jgi:choline dehydrogenase-like flavoprotein
MPRKFDLDDRNLVLIVGSGAGGGTLGHELAQKGIRTLILEAGPRIEPAHHIDDERQSLQVIRLKPLGFCSTPRVPSTRTAWRTLRDKLGEIICVI